jgi:hypothetical protein
MTSRFLKKAALPVSRFLARHHRINRVAHRALNRIVRRVPIVTKFLAFFVVEELKPEPPKLAPVEPQIAPVYNARARKPKGLTLG